jgi:hypothetical protein
MDLQQQIIERSREIQTDGYAMSIGEILSLYRDREIDIHPEFQRIFRWKIEKKSRLIESILLGIPIPPIFVSQRLDGAWDVIDGVQRLSTIFEFMGEYREEDGGIRRPAPLQGTEYLSEVFSVRRNTQSAQIGQMVLKRTTAPVGPFVPQTARSLRYEIV